MDGWIYYWVVVLPTYLEKSFLPRSIWCVFGFDCFAFISSLAKIFPLPLSLASVTHLYNITIFLNWSFNRYFFFIETSVLEKEKLIGRIRGGALRPNIGEALAKRNLWELNFYKSKLQFWFWILLEGIEYYLRLQYDGYWDLEVHPDLHSPQEGRQWCGLNFLPSGQFEPNLSRFSYFFVSIDIYMTHIYIFTKNWPQIWTLNVYLCRYR